MTSDRLLPVEHGGQLERIQRQFPHIKDWLDLSTGISPWYYEGADVGDIFQAAQSLPSETLQKQTEAIAAKYFGTAEETVLASAGAQAVIRALPQLAERILSHKPNLFIAAPTYNEYARSAELHGCKVQTLSAPYPQEFPDGALVILGNPNNPDGQFLSTDEAEQIAKPLHGKGLLVIDEAFCDLYPEKSLTPLVERYDNLLVLKSFGKFFGLAGLRLGFAVGAPSLLAPLATILGVWTVATPALTVAKQAYGDSSWISSQRRRITEQADKLQNLLQAKSDIITNCGLFITCKSDNDLFTHLAEQGIYIRAFSTDKNLYRFGLPADEATLARLQKAL